MTVAQHNILRLLYDPQYAEPGASSLNEGLDASASALVKRGLLWKQDGKGKCSRPTYGLTPAGIDAAKSIWQDA